MEKLFEDERDKVRELLRPIERVSHTTDTWTTTQMWQYLGSQYIGLMICGDFMNKCLLLRSWVYHIEG